MLTDLGPLLDALPDAVIGVDAHAVVCYFNAGAEALFEVDRREVIGRNCGWMLPAGGAGWLGADCEATLAAVVGRTSRLASRRRDGSSFVAELTVSVLEDADPWVALSTVRDAGALPVGEAMTPGLAGVTAHRAATAPTLVPVDHEQALEVAEARWHTVFDAAPVGMARVGLDGRFLQVNAAFCELVGFPADQVDGRTFADLTHPGDVDAAWSCFAGLRTGAALTGRLEQRYVHADGEVVWVAVSMAAMRGPGGVVDHVLTHAVDLTDRKRIEAELAHLTGVDPLTGLRNRRSFTAALEQHAKRVQHIGPQGALLMLDLDHFKAVNDLLGPRAGDELIVSTADMLRRHLREHDIVARLGGDEFAVLLPMATPDTAEQVAAKLVRAVREEVMVRSGRHHRVVTTSIGVAFFDGPAGDGEEVLMDADLLMYDAKESGRNRYTVARADGLDVSRTKARLAWAERIESALRDESFELLLQPIRDLRDGTTDRYELLLRMVGDDGELITPNHFLHVAERVGLVGAIDRWVVSRAIELLAGNDLPRQLEVNLSGLSVGSPELSAFIEHRLRKTGVDPSRLILEVTETAAVANMAAARRFAERLSRVGCRFALDDFGAGFGSFYYLKHLPFDYLKIDGEFVTNLVSNPTDALLVRAVVEVAKGLGKRTIAEFVENQATVDYLLEIGVDFAQGYHIGRPAPRDSFSFDGGHRADDSHPPEATRHGVQKSLTSYPGLGLTGVMTGRLRHSP